MIARTKEQYIAKHERRTIAKGRSKYRKERLRLGWKSSGAKHALLTWKALQLQRGKSGSRPEFPERKMPDGYVYYEMPCNPRPHIVFTNLE